MKEGETGRSRERERERRGGGGGGDRGIQKRKWSMPNLCAPFQFHLSPRLFPSTAGCSPPPLSSLVLCLLLSCSRWFPPSLLCRLAIFCLVVLLISSLDLLGCHSVQRLVHLLSFILAICRAHLHFCFSVYSIMSIIFVLLLISEYGIYLVALDPTSSSPLLFEQFSVCLSIVYR